MIHLTYTDAICWGLVWFATVLATYAQTSTYHRERHIETLQSHLTFMRRFIDEETNNDAG